MKKFVLGVLAIALGWSLTSCGLLSPTPIEVIVTLTEYKIEISRTEFSPTSLYKFIISNKGNTAHELLLLPLGDPDRTHAFKGVSDLLPGTTIERYFRFERRTMPAGNYEFACHYIGHYENGMVVGVKIQ
jgi:uncharacterized cupredoxin-like copper-binding protein